MLILIHGFYSKLKTILPFNINLLIIYLAALGVSLQHVGSSLLQAGFSLVVVLRRSCPKSCPGMWDLGFPVRN